MIRVKDKNGTEALVTQKAFDDIWSKPKHGFTLVEDEPKLGNEPVKSKSKRKDSTK